METSKPEWNERLFIRRMYVNWRSRTEIKAYFLERGYEEIRTPTIEFYDVFAFQNRPIDEEKMYKFLMKRKDYRFTSRYDNSFSESYWTQRWDTPLKVTYSGNVFRANESHSGKYNEIVQSGIEVVGVDNVRAEIECVISVIQALQKLKVQSFTIEIGQVQLYKCIVKTLHPWWRRKGT